ncbi:hypothetical protein [Stenotrophomonas sp. RG-453]|uniref:hypothetical protein n=1 Tax=Stenotrophomonas sp. RG-453 TaxID=2957502 RepID=UPI0029CA0F39|nr:hypothetical protein [Stenotrophomonas sp. RG-453]MDX5515111.1 hypothetical protein [Stenotrophomonas sp. RG-453]
MTTLAYDGRLVAIDSQVTAGGIRYEEDKSYAVTTDDGKELIVFGAGTSSEIQQAVREIAAGDERLSMGDYSVLVVGLRETPVVYYGEDGLACDVRRDLFVAGSGAPIALAGMKDGKTATEAVLLACTTDLYSGPPVRTYDTQRRTWLKPRR